MDAFSGYALAFAIGLGFANGTNDLANGASTWRGSGLLSERSARMLGSAAALVGGISASFVGEELIRLFQFGFGDAAPWDAYLVALGVSGTVIGGSYFYGVPVSTTHTLVSSILGALFVSGTSISWRSVLIGITIPAILALALPVAIGLLVRLIRTRGLGRSLGRGSEGGGTKVSGKDPYGGRGIVSNYSARWTNYTHITSGCLLSFARGLSNTGKIAGVCFSAGGAGFGLTSLCVIVAGSMSLGSLLNGSRISSHFARDIFDLNIHSGSSASAINGLLFVVASVSGYGISSTHLTLGSIVGGGVSFSSRSKGLGFLSKSLGATIMGPVVAFWLSSLLLLGWRLSGS